MRGIACLILLVAFFSSQVQAQTQTSKLPSAERLQAVADAKQWAHLLHYRIHPYSFRYISQNDSPNFFLAADGKQSLFNELTAALQEFLKTNQADNESAQCRFPARYFWLKQQFPELAFVDQPCSTLSKWQHELNAHSLTLIFPASHINSPSSMYGHTLVRLDPEDQSRSKLLAYSVNFAANADSTDNELVFTYKGLMGGYPGVVSITPYYVKTNEYQQMEARDVWEYPLSFTPAETAQFVRHIWETQDTFFDYFFFDENCSYRLLALLDASSERADVTDQFMLTAMPVDTIRALQQQGLVAGREYRASAAAVMEYKSAQASPAVLDAAKALVDTEAPIVDILTGLNERDQARALELAHAYARYLSIKKRQASPALRARTIAILSARSKISAAADFAEVPTPAYSHDQGHLSRRVTLTGGIASYEHGSDAEFVDLSFRNAYHDVMDLPQGFVSGSQIQMGQLDLRLWDNGAVRLQQFKVLDILSLSEQTHFQSPVAWAVSGGFERFLGEHSDLYGYIKTAFGRAWLSPLGRLYAMGELQLLIDNQFDDNVQLSVGPRLGWLWQQRAVQAQVESTWQPLALGEQMQRTELAARLGVRLSDNVQVRVQAKRQWFDKQSNHGAVDELSAGLNWYF